MLNIVEFMLDLVDIFSSVLKIRGHLIAYWRFWFPTVVAGFATWGFTSQLSNMSACIATGILFMLIGVICGLILQDKFGPG